MIDGDNEKVEDNDSSKLLKNVPSNQGQNQSIHKNQMAASYIEISYQSNDAANSYKVVEINSTNKDDDKDLNKIPLEADACETYRETDELLKRPVSLLCAFPNDWRYEGIVRKEGDMTHFVAENLENKIKLSSPVTKRDINHPSTSSKNTTPSNSAWMLSKHYLQTNLIQIDSNVLSDIEVDAQYLAASVDYLTENLYNLLHSVSSITADNVEIHKNSVNKLTDNIDANIKCMYTIMAKTEEISKSMKPTEQLAIRIREIKRLVDMLESNT